MQWALSVKNIFEQWSGKPGFYYFTGVDVLLKLIFPGEDKQGTLLHLCHAITGEHDGIGIDTRLIINIQPPEKKASSFAPHECGGSQGKEKTPDLRLKNNNECNKPYTYKGPEYLAKQFHLQRIHDLPDQHNCNDPEEDVNSNGAFQELIQLIQKQRYQEDINDINPPDLNKTGDKKVSQS